MSWRSFSVYLNILYVYEVINYYIYSFTIEMTNYIKETKQMTRIVSNDT